MTDTPPHRAVSGWGRGVVMMELPGAPPWSKRHSIRIAKGTRMGTEIRTDENVLAFAINDAINMFVREVLVGKGIVDQSTIDAHEQDIDAGRRALISVCVDNWRVSTLNEDV